MLGLVGFKKRPTEMLMQKDFELNRSPRIEPDLQRVIDKTTQTSITLLLSWIDLDER
jgi:uncharacterized protein YabE (DUF348 family)